MIGAKGAYRGVSENRINKVAHAICQFWAAGAQSPRRILKSSSLLEGVRPKIVSSIFHIFKISVRNRQTLEMLSHYVVHWSGYQAHLQTACCDQFLSEKFVDVTLAVDAGLIKCHRVILSAASGYFHQLLSQHDSSHPIIFMRDMQYWELIALVDFMYRGEVAVEADRLEQLMWSASQLQIHGLAACLKACIQRNQDAEQERPCSAKEYHQAVTEGELEDDSQESNDLGDADGIPSSLSKLCELNSELELRPITSTATPGNSGASKHLSGTSEGCSRKGSRSGLPPPPLHSLNADAVSLSQKDVVKEEIEFIEEKPLLSPTEDESSLQIQNVFSECSNSFGKGEASDECIDIEEEPLTITPPATMLQNADRSFRQFLLLSPVPEQSQESNQQRTDFSKMTLTPPLYKRYSPGSLEQALRDLQTGRFKSIRACARHYGIPMTTLRYRAKGKTHQRPWLSQ